jgi:transcriptional regulator with XRE-family HTH domain
MVYAMELQNELVRDSLTRKQLAERHGISSDRVTQWLCLLKLPDHEKARILALGDYWERQVVTERELRKLRRVPK